MASPPAQAVELVCHPETPGPAVRSIIARVRRTADGALQLGYVVEADLDGLRIPSPLPPRAAGGLWRHTCCEVFVACRESPGYHEFNFSPSGEWAAYAYDRYREGGPLADVVMVRALAPHVTVRAAEGKLELDAVISMAGLPAIHRCPELSLGLSAVVESRDGTLSYWALRHPPGRPDFHHAVAFALDLAGPDR